VQVGARCLNLSLLPKHLGGRRETFYPLSETEGPRSQYVMLKALCGRVLLECELETVRCNLAPYCTPTPIACELGPCASRVAMTEDRTHLMAHTLRSRDVCDSLSHSPHRAHTRDSQSGTHTLHTRCACTKAQDVQWQAVIKPSRRRVVHVGARRRRRRRRRRPWMRGRQARASASEKAEAPYLRWATRLVRARISLRQG